MAITPQDRRQVRDLWRKVLKEAGPLIEAALQRKIDAGDGSPTMNPGVTVSQNMLRICLEEAIGESSRSFIHDPASAKHFLSELAIRAAAYCISAAPLEEQAEMTAIVAQALPACVAGMRTNGFVIRCEWNFGQGWEPNLPAGGMN